MNHSIFECSVVKEGAIVTVDLSPCCAVGVQKDGVILYELRIEHIQMKVQQITTVCVCIHKLLCHPFKYLSIFLI